MDPLRRSTLRERENIGRGAKGFQGHKKEMAVCTCHYLPITCDERSSSRVNTLLTNPFPRPVTVTA